jgi:hypothetical protein
MVMGILQSATSDRGRGAPTRAATIGPSAGKIKQAFHETPSSAAEAHVNRLT